jgi:hypothetical protein
MVFIDGGWLYRNRNTLFAKLGEENFEIDYAKLPRLFCEDVANRLDEDVSLVRTNYFGTIPSARSGFNTSKQYAFYDFLERSCGYETDIHEVEVGTDENWIKMSLSAALLFYAAQPGAYDIAILIGDDPDYGPALRRARLFGKRIQIVGAHTQDGKEPPSASTLANRLRVSDFPHLYLDDHAAEVRLVRELVKRTCKQCGREEETTWAGPEFFCSSCRGRYRT